MPFWADALYVVYRYYYSTINQVGGIDCQKIYLPLFHQSRGKKTVQSVPLRQGAEITLGIDKVLRCRRQGGDRGVEGEFRLVVQELLDHPLIFFGLRSCR